MTRLESAQLPAQKRRRIILIRILMFMAAVAVITYFFPREGKFRYQFQESKPWKYGLLTAAFTFPIHKTDDVIKRERDSALKEFRPYYALNRALPEKQKKQMLADLQQTADKENKPLLTYLERALTHVYETGIISAADQEKIVNENGGYLRLIDRNIGKIHKADSLFTTKTAYEYVLNNAPSYLSQNKLKSLNINTYLTENITFDEKTNDQVVAEILGSLSLTSGMVQVGERIVDKGEIIDSETYNILRSLKMTYEERAGTVQQQSWVVLGEVILISSLFAFLFLFLYLFRYNTFVRLKLLFFILMVMTGMVILTALNAKLKVFSIYIIPFAIVPIIIRTFFDSRTALFTHLITVMICAFMAPFPFEFILLQITVGMTAIYSLKDLTQRSQLMQSSILILITYTFIYLGYALIQEGTWSKINWNMFIYFVINGLLLLFAYLLIYMFEKAFGFVSHVTLVELSNINSPFLRKFSEECPGTFHHSLQVSNLAAEASMRVNANTQLIRTAALYHDIGKMENPVFFTENQTGINPHDKLNAEQSAHIIVDHVERGAQMARKLGLPAQIIDFIYMHHGRSKAKYFYNSYKNQFPDREVNEENFMYPGPNPATKETAILMMADSVEAASRSLSEYTEESITGLVEKIINGQIQEGLFNQAPITLRDIETIKQLFIEKLKTYYHTRISYPELNTTKPE